jgi:antitoxin (DNA-binding transcriptional repressor) of toxin-antitoxin stability system
MAGDQGEAAKLDKVTTGDYYRGMKAVGVKVLKAKLSEYLRLVKAGETVLVTDRDEIIAELRPANRQKAVSQDIDDVLKELADQGRALLRAQEPSSWKGPTAKARIKIEDVDRVLNELRGEED